MKTARHVAAWLALAALLVGCTKAEPLATQAPEEANATEPRADQAAAAPPEPVAAPAATRTEPDRSCEADSDCVVAHAFAGLDYIPADPAQAECGDLCFVAMSQNALAAWDEARATSAAEVPCDKKFAKCGQPSDAVAACMRGRCELSK